MAIGRLKQSGHSTYGLMEYVVDTEADIQNLSVEVAMGSKCFVIATSKNYMLNSKGEWVELTGGIY